METHHCALALLYLFDLEYFVLLLFSSLRYVVTPLALLSIPLAASAWTFGNGTTYGTNRSISGDGRYVVFSSEASNLVPNDTNNAADIFLLDTQNGSVKRLSIATDGTQASSDSYGAVISANGQKVAFYSFASNLVSNDTNVRTDIFVHDIATATTTRVSVDSGGNQANSFGNGAMHPSISADGTRIAFQAHADNLVPNDTNGAFDVFVHDLATGITTRASVTSTGGEANANCLDACISGDGNHVAFTAQATNMVPGDTNGYDDIFLRDLVDNTTTHVSVADDETAGNQPVNHASVSHDGNRVAFASNSLWWTLDDTNINYDIFVRDIAAGTTVLASRNTAGDVQDGGVDIQGAISSDGTHVAFATAATNLVAGDTPGTVDVFVRNLSTGVTTLASQGPAGIIGNGTSKVPALSSNGNRVAFVSEASNLVTGDTNGVSDLFVHDVAGASTSVPVTVSKFSME